MTLQRCRVKKKLFSVGSFALMLQSKYIHISENYNFYFFSYRETMKNKIPIHYKYFRRIMREAEKYA